MFSLHSSFCCTCKCRWPILFSSVSLWCFFFCCSLCVVVLVVVIVVIVVAVVDVVAAVVATTHADAESATLTFLQEHLDPGKSPLCGNSICQDRRFLAEHMPDLESFLHYRNLDVSSIKELAVRWRPGLAGGFSKKGGHRALDDILESIEELKYYREHFFNITVAQKTKSPKRQGVAEPR